MPRTRPAYPDEFRQEAVAMVRGGRSVRDVAESLGVSQRSLRKWVKQTELDGRERDDGLPQGAQPTCTPTGRRAMIPAVKQQLHIKVSGGLEGDFVVTEDAARTSS